MLEWFTRESGNWDKVEKEREYAIMIAFHGTFPGELVEMGDCRVFITFLPWVNLNIILCLRLSFSKKTIDRDFWESVSWRECSQKKPVKE